MSKSTTSWLDQEDDRTDKEIKKGQIIKNPSATKKIPKKETRGRPKKREDEKETEVIGVRVTNPVKIRFSYLIQMGQAKSLLANGVKPNQSEVLEEMLNLYEKKLKL